MPLFPRASGWFVDYAILLLTGLGRTCISGLKMGKERKLGVQEKAPRPFRQSDTSPLAMARRMLSQFLLQIHRESSLGAVGNREET